jgi:O-antigen ligase
LIEGHPLLGSGLGTFPVAFTAVQSTFLGKFVNHAHNDYLEIANDLGIPVAILLFASIVMLFARLARRMVSADVRFERAVALGCMGSIAAILLHSLTDFNLYIPANALLFSLVLGLASAMCVGEPARTAANL